MKKILQTIITLLLFSVAFATHPLSDINSSAVTMLAIHLDHSQSYNQKLLMNGDMGIILYSTRNDRVKPTVRDLHYFANLNELIKMEHQKDGRIDWHDKAMPQLFLLTFLNNGRKYNLVPIQKTGVRALYLTKEHIKNSNDLKDADASFHKVAEFAIMSDGSKRLILPIVVNRSLLDVFR